MKRCLFYIFVICSSIVASQAADSKRLVEANAKYSSENYAAADSLYQLVIQEEGVSAAVYYNLGNAKYKLGEIGPAILNYERALLLDPDNEDIKFNLEMAKLRTTDKIDELDNFLVSEWNKSVKESMSSDAWAYLSIAFFLVTLVGMALYFFGRIGWLRKTAFFAGIFTFVMCIISVLYARSTKEEQVAHDMAIIFAPSVTGKGSPDNSGTDLFLLHEGTKVKVKSRLNGWVEIQISDGNTGWIPEGALEVI